MTEPALGLAGAILLGMAIMALVLGPRRSKGRFVDTGLAVGTGLLGLAIGLVVAEQVARPATASAVAAEPVPAPAAISSPRHVESRLALQFAMDDEYPIGSGQRNVADWYAFRNSISYVPDAEEKTGKSQDELLKLVSDGSWSWLIVVAFDQPTRYSHLDVNFAGGQLPSYQVTRQDPHYAVIHVQGRIPPGQMEIVASE
jgi:hypothetical protein